ncbi:MAG: TIR domain-containing protein [Chitinivibrionales bacterium]|nr:TIR domain-containing protein [Chitinivibrionales bacterium]
MRLPEDIQQILRSLTEVLKTRGIARLARMLQHATVDIRETDYDPWNGGTYGYTVTLRVPIEAYAHAQDDIKAIEADLEKKLGAMTRSYENEYVRNIIIEPRLVDSGRGADVEQPTDDAPLLGTPLFWQQGYFRLFLSHVAEHKRVASQLQCKFRDYAISLFVAHEDIEPNKEWQDEIELALASMDGLLALLTKGFPQSKWCDQEVGVAIGRKVPVVPIRAEIDPYGFIGKFQGIAAHNKAYGELCEEVFKVLLRNDKARPRVASAVVHKICASDSYKETHGALKLLDRVRDSVTSEMAQRLLSACQANEQVKGAFGAVEKIKTIVEPETGTAS